MAKPMTRKQSITAAAQALSDLNTFAIVVTILEGGHIHADSDATAQKIIALCQREQQKLLSAYDSACDVD